MFLWLDFLKEFLLQIYFFTLTPCIHAPFCTLDRRACLCIALCPSLWNMYIIDMYTYVKCQSKSIRRRAWVWVNTILGVASSPNYYFTRRSYTRWYESWVAVGPYSWHRVSPGILFYRDIIVELECHGVTWHNRECLVRLVSFRGECRLLDISSS